ncbi:YdeI/OmpD-associated family protein [Paenibacillus borealis]|uniref:Thymidylate synthase n=1 Tax=Paenibacillus borealis TaxID=160799 RepID=A0A089L9X6_PAEBO|nr:YdeI/OmpD-associated family protein [Paenibacillus borealis]AIQ57632.1 thymidylate synthase [Paenibacillus borealis]
MNTENLIAATSREELRNWLMVNSTAELFCRVEVSMKPLPGTLLYLDAVEEALCFGWIDGVKKVNAEAKLVQRLSPRSRRSSWTELNKERVRRLEKLGLMRDEGRRVLPDMDINSFRIDEVIEQKLKEDMQVYENFIAFPALYRRVRIDTIQSYIHQPDLFQRRLEKFIANTRDNTMYGQWHDNGRLLEY